MGRTTAAVLVFALVLLVSWLGGRRKWAFRAMLSLLIVGFLGVVGFLGYGLWSERTAERQRLRLHECAIAKIATAKCVSSQARRSSSGVEAVREEGRAWHVGEIRKTDCGLLSRIYAL